MSVKSITLPAGSTLYHGTAAVAEFERLIAPAWFTLDKETAERWAGWVSTDTGQRRVLAFQTVADVSLRDTRELIDWRRHCDCVCGDPDATTWEAAKWTAEAGIPGWFGATEVLLTVLTILQFIETSLVPPGVRSFGDVKP